MDAGLVADLVGVAELAQAPVGPVADGDHDGVLVHGEFALLVELEEALPGVAEAVGPFAGVGVFLVPDEFFGPEPAGAAHGEDQFEDVGVALAAHGFLFDVEDECAVGAEDALDLVGEGHEPFDVGVGVDAAVGVAALVGVGR